MKIANKIIMIATGGTGGHVFPAQAVAEKLQKENYNLHLICDKRAKKYLDGIFCDIDKTIILSSNLRHNLISKIFNLVLILISSIKIMWKFFFNRPKVVISFGGYTTIPASLYSVIFCVPLVLHEQNAILGHVNRLFLPFATQLFLSFPVTQKIKNKYKNKIFITGLPIRNKLVKEVKCNATYSKSEAKVIKILVIGGSQGARLFSHIMPRAIYSLDKLLQDRIQITQQVRNEDMDYVRDVYSKTICKYDIDVFFTNISELYKNNDLIISRAGASSIVEISSFQKAVILVPLAQALDNHQFYNAKYLSENSDVILREESEFSVEWLACYIKLFLRDTNAISKIQNSYNKQLRLLYVNSIETFYEKIRLLTK